MKKKFEKLINSKKIALICIFIILFSFFCGTLGQTLGFKEIQDSDREGNKHIIKVPEAGDAVKIPEEIEQAAASFETYNRDNWIDTNKKIYDKWEEQGKPHTNSHWAYIEISGKPRYLVAVTSTYGQTGDYIDIEFCDDGKTIIYPCIIGDIKDIWVDNAFVYEGVAYGHMEDGKCNIVEVCSELPGEGSSYAIMNPLLNSLYGVTQIANGGNMFENPDGPVGLDGNYTYLDGTSSGGLDDESDTYNGAFTEFFRNLWNSLAVSFENGLTGKNNTTILYDIKNLDRGDIATAAASGITDEQIQAIFEEYQRNAGKPYVLDHSNYKADECMDYYDCSSWTIHCLNHTGIRKLPISTANEIYEQYCVRIGIDERQPGDLIFMQGTQDGKSGATHVGIYLGTFTFEGETAEWIVDTGGNPKGVKLSKLNNGWWGGKNFLSFGRLKN